LPKVSQFQLAGNWPESMTIMCIFFKSRTKAAAAYHLGVVDSKTETPKEDEIL
jgi:hypothetical protein